MRAFCPHWRGDELRTDSDPYRVTGADRNSFQRLGEKDKTRGHGDQSEHTGAKSVKPSVYFNPIAQPISNRPLVVK